MSTSLPTVQLEKGLFSYEDGVPVFIDDKETRHYEIGNSMEVLFRAGMMHQSLLDGASLSVLDRRITVLHEQLELAQKQLSVAYSDGRNDQLVEDREHSLSLYKKGRLDQQKLDRQEISAAYRSGAAAQAAHDHELFQASEREKIFLHEKLVSLNELLQKARRIMELNLSPRLVTRTISDSSKDALQPSVASLHPLSSSPHASSFDQSLESVAISTRSRKDEDCLGFAGASECLSGETIDVSQESPTKQIEWMCDQLAGNPSFLIPQYCSDALSNCISKLCADFKTGYPAFFAMIRSFRRLPSKSSLPQLFAIPISKREKGVLSAIRAALKDTGETDSDRQLLAAVKEHLQGKAYKSLRSSLDNELASLYSSFDACLDDAQWQLANKILMNAIKEHKQGNDPTKILQWLQKFSAHPRTLLLTRDRIFQLLDRDSTLFSHIQNLIQATAESMKETRPEELRGWYLKFFETKISKEQLILFLGEALAAEHVASPLPVGILSAELVAYWVQHKENEACAHAFWISLRSCPIHNDAWIELCIESVEEMHKASCLPKYIKEVSIKEGLLHILRIYSQRPKSKPIGSILVFLLRFSWDTFSPLEKERIVKDFGRGAEKYPATLEYRNFLRLLIWEMRNNKDLWVVQTPDFFEEVLAGAKVVLSVKEPLVQDEIALACLQILDLIDYEQPHFQKMILLTDEAQPFFDRICTGFMGTVLEEKIPSLKFKSNCIMNKVLYKSRRDFARGQFKVEIKPEKWEAIDEEVLAYIDIKNFTPDLDLFNVRFMTHAKFVTTNRLLEELTVGGLTTERMEELENAVNVFNSQQEEQFENDPIVRKIANFYYVALALAAMRHPEAWSRYTKKNLKSAIQRIIETDYMKYNELTYMLKGCAESDDAYLYTTGVELVLEKIQPLSQESAYQIFLVNVAYALESKQRYNELCHFLNRWKTTMPREKLEEIFKVLDGNNIAHPDALLDLDVVKHYLIESSAIPKNHLV
jgi:hypothetical protein